MEDKKRNYIINYKGKKIFYHDHSGLSGEDLINNLKDGVEFTIQNNKGEEILDMSNWMNTSMTSELMDYLKSDKVVQVNKNIKKTAVLGIIGIKKIFLNVYNKFTGGKTKAFDNEEEAKEWLIKD